MQATNAGTRSGIVQIGGGSVRRQDVVEKVSCRLSDFKAMGLANKYADAIWWEFVVLAPPGKAKGRVIAVQLA